MDAGEQRDGGEQRDTDAGEQRDGSEQRDAEAGEERDAGGEERDVADSEEEKEVDSDETDVEWFINFSCMLNEVEAEVETDGYHSEELNIPISSDDEDEDVEVYPQYSQSSGVGEQKLELGMEFGTLDEFKSALREYSILMGREFKWKKNDKQRARAKCKKAFCDWEIYCAKNEGLIPALQEVMPEKEFHFANQWTPIWCGDNMGLRYEVHMWGNKVEVNLGEWTCTCGVPATIVPPIARNKLTITRAKQRKVADKDDAEN
ncbi:hypothetical protein GmHk_02G005130 [Glycine max]|nr:hypothetical protein GmHk_02G005130 [Glycine max]